MARLNAALIALLLAPTALARGKYGNHGTGVKHHKKPCSTGFPYHLSNDTAAPYAPTTIIVSPLPLSTESTASDNAAAPGAAMTTPAADDASSCGLSTITVTSEATVTVTESAGSDAAAPTDADTASTPLTISSATSVAAPFPAGNATLSASGSSGSAPIYVYQPSVSPVAAAAFAASSGHGHKHVHTHRISTLAAASVTSSMVAAASSSSSSPVAAALEASSPVAPVAAAAAASPTSSVAGDEDFQLKSSAAKPKKTSTTSSVVPVAAPKTQDSPVAPTATTAASPGSTTGSGGSNGSFKTKRGVGFNDASYVNDFKGSKVSWAYNWGFDADSTLDSDFTYIPLLWSPDKSAGWNETANAAIEKGVPYLFSFNEPDQPKQAFIDPPIGASQFKTLMNPLAGKGAAICAPAVTQGSGPDTTNGDGGNFWGLDWLLEFEKHCNGECKYDYINLHWYGYTGQPVASVVDTLMSHIQNATTLFPGKKVFLSEFSGAFGSSQQDQIDFMNLAVPKLEASDDVIAYSWFMANTGYLNSDSGLNDLGTIYGKL